MTGACYVGYFFINGSFTFSLGEIYLWGSSLETVYWIAYITTMIFHPFKLSIFLRAWSQRATPDFKRRGWSNMGKNQNSKKSLGLLNNSLDQKINPWKIQQPQNKFSCTLFVELRGRDTRVLPWIFRLFWMPKNSLFRSSHPNTRIKNINPLPRQKNS